MLREVLLPFQAGADEAQDFSGMVFDFFFRRADASGGVATQIIAGIRQLGEAVAVKDQLARLGEQTGGDAAGAQRGHLLLGAADDNQRRILVRGHAMLGKNRLRQDVHRAAARRAQRRRGRKRKSDYLPPGRQGLIKRIENDSHNPTVTTPRHDLASVTGIGLRDLTAACGWRLRQK